MEFHQKIVVAKLLTVHRSIGFDTIFINDLAKNNQQDLSERQNEFIFRLLYKYRRSLPHTYNAYKTNIFCRAKRQQKTLI
jgi:endo-beta-N-acetylglucosaminidase D